MGDVNLAGRRLRRRERKRTADDREPMSGRRAYLAAQEVLEEGFDLWKKADHKARVALWLLLPLVIILLLLFANRDVFAGLPPRARWWIMMGLFVYAVLGIVMFLLAIGTLRPERAAPVIGEATLARRHAPLGIRHYEDVLGWDLDDYQRAWRRVTREQLVEEIAEQSHVVAKANRRKFRTLHYLFRGLQGLTALALLLLLGIALALFLAGQMDKIRRWHGVELRSPAHGLSKAASAPGGPHDRAAHGS